MKLLLLVTFIALICNVNAGKSSRMLAAMLAGMNGGMANGGVPVRMTAGLNAPMVAVGGVGLAGQQQFAQFVPGVSAFAVQAPVPNVYAVPAGNSFPFMGVPQMAGVNPPQQPLMGIPGSALPQQLPFQPDPLIRFKRQIRNPDTMKNTLDTQIPAPTQTTTPTPCNKEGHHEDDSVQNNSI